MKPSSQVLVLYACAVLALLAFPPFYADLPKVTYNMGHAFFLVPPERGSLPAMVAWKTLAVYIAGLTAAAGALWLALRNHPEPAEPQ